MQFSYLHFKHTNILHTSEGLSRSNFFSGVYHPQYTRDEKHRTCLGYDKGWSNISDGFHNPNTVRIGWNPPTYPQILTTTNMKSVHFMNAHL